MRSAIKAVVFVICAVLLLTPSTSFGLASGGGDGCQACYNYCDPQTGISWAYCASPQDGDWGQANCSVDCVKYGSGMGACGCSTSGSGCMYIVVQG